MFFALFIVLYLELLIPSFNLVDIFTLSLFIFLDNKLSNINFLNIKKFLNICLDKFVSILLFIKNRHSFFIKELLRLELLIPKTSNKKSNNLFELPRASLLKFLTFVIIFQLSFINLYSFLFL